MRLARALVAIAALAVTPFACSKAPVTPPDTKCDPGTTVFCRCPDGEPGSRTCNTDGQSFTACVLEENGAPCPTMSASSSGTGATSSASASASASSSGATASSSATSSSSGAGGSGGAGGAGGAGGGATYDCPGAPVVVSLAADATVNGDTSLAKDAHAGPCGGAGAPDFVFEVTPQSSGTVSATVTGAALDAVLYATNAPCGTGVSLGCSDATGPAGAETLTLEAVSGAPFYLYVDGHGGSAGAFSLHLHMTAGVPGDTCPGVPVAIDLGQKLTLGGDTSIASANYKGTGACSAGMSTKDIVYGVTPSSDGTLVVTMTPDPGFDAVLYARSGSCTAGTQIGCADAAGPGGVETISVPVTSGAKVSVFADGHGMSAGAYTLELDLQ